MDATFRLYDVTMWMEDFVFPGDRPLTVTGPINVLSGENPEYVYEFAVSTQAGTHVQGRTTSCEAARGSTKGRARLVDLSKRGVDTTAEDLGAVLGEQDLTGNVLVLRTGHMDELVAGAPLVPETRPRLSMDAARSLVEDRGIGIAIDSVGVESR